jgi:hypothetical protein
MSNKKEFGDLEPIDLSVGSRSRKSAEIVDYMEQEFKGLAGFVSDRLSANSSFDRVVKIPSSMGFYLDKYEGTAFKGVVSLILEVAGDRLYHDVADNFVKSVYNSGVRASGLPGSMRLDVQDNKQTRAYGALEVALDQYQEAKAYFFHDVGKYPFRDGKYSALDVSYLLEAEKLKVLDLQGQMGKMGREYDKLSKTLSDRNLRVSDLSGVIASLKNEKVKFDEFRYYHFAVPRLFRILRMKLVKALAAIRKKLGR